MIRLVLLLLGADFVRRQSRPLCVLGAVCIVAGVALGIDALDGRTIIAPRHYSYFLLGEGLLSIPLAFAAVSLTRRLQFIKATMLILVAVMILLLPWHSNFIFALAFGFAFACDGGLRVASALIVRYQTWRAGLALGIVQLLFAVFMVEPWPTRYAGTIGFNVGLALTLTGLGLVLTARRLKRLSPAEPLAALLHRNFPRMVLPAFSEHRPHGEMIVHVWTPTGSATTAAQRPLVDRYVAAVDTKGVISTGHAALEFSTDLYISHYPAQEFDRSPSDFTRILRATHDNDVPGRFIPSFAIEREEWCGSTVQIGFPQFDAGRLAAFWAAYRQDATYNLTSRNCTSVVAQALDVALEGSFGRRKTPVWETLHLLLRPEMWIAAQMRQRAETMAWTPGLMCDYARALRLIMEPSASPFRAFFARGIGWRHRAGDLRHALGAGAGVRHFDILVPFGGDALETSPVAGNPSVPRPVPDA